MSSNPSSSTSSANAGSGASLRIAVETGGTSAPGFEGDLAMVTIGRNEAAILPVADPALSEFHCAVVPWAGGTVVLVDLSSGKGGTLLNGARADVALLSSGDTARIGGTTLAIEFEVGEGMVAPAAPQAEPQAPVWSAPEPDEEITEDDLPAVGMPAEPEPFTGTSGMGFEVYTRGTYVTTYTSSDETITIGRGLAAMLQIDDAGIADLHAAVTTDDSGAVQILDLGAETGTQVNGEHVNAHELRDGDTIAIGNSTLTFRRGSR